MLNAFTMCKAHRHTLTTKERTNWSYADAKRVMKCADRSMATIALLYGLLLGSIQATAATSSTSDPPSTTSRLMPSVSTAASVSSTLPGSLLSSSPAFYRPGASAGYYYYQAFEVTVYTSGNYRFASNSSIDTYGYLYIDTFDPSVLSNNIVASDDDSNGNGQFLINATLQFGRVYVLLVTTFASAVTGSFEVTVQGPHPINWIFFIVPTSSSRRTTLTSATMSPSVYFSSLSGSSPFFTRPNGNSNSYYYYQAYRVTVYSSNIFNFTSTSSMDTYGCLYAGSFDPSFPNRNLMAYDDDSNGNSQFLISIRLQPSDAYVLVVTTYRPATTGNFLVVANEAPWVILSAFTPVTIPPTRTTGRTSTAGLSSIAGELSIYSPQFSRPGGSNDYYYYQAFRVYVYATGTYSFSSVGSLDTYGYFYNDPVNPFIPSNNLLASDDDSAGNRQFRISIRLQADRIYVLLVTTYSSCTTGSFSIAVNGSSTAVRLSSFTPSTSRPIISTRPPPSTFSGYLSSDQTFSRPGRGKGFYYRTLHVTVAAGGSYSFASSSSMDTFGYFYRDSFDPSAASSNLMQSDDDGAGGSQFRIDITLQSGRTYVLLVTTYRPGVGGSFSITATGPGRVTFSSFTPSSSESDPSKRAWTIVGVCLGCVIVIVIVAVACAQAKKKRANVSPRGGSSTHIQNASTQQYPMTSINQNRSSANGTWAPYAATMSPVYSTNLEAPPPSYNVYVASLPTDQRAKFALSAQNSNQF